MTSAKKTLVSAKNKIVRNKTRILGTVAVVSTTAAVLLYKGNQQMNAFLEEKGLSDEYYQPEEDI